MTNEPSNPVWPWDERPGFYDAEGTRARVERIARERPDLAEMAAATLAHIDEKETPCAS